MALLWFTLAMVIIALVGLALRGLFHARKPRGSDDHAQQPDNGPSADRLGQAR
jgi:hypothetical protein